MPPKHKPAQKGAITLGFERLLNDNQASPLYNPAVYNSLMNTAGQPLSTSLKYIGKKGTKQPDPSKVRLEKLEAAHEAN